MEIHMIASDIPLADYRTAVDHILYRHFGVDSWEAGLTDDELALAREQSLSPESFALQTGDWLADCFEAYDD
jgi:hypothetical protein